MISAFDGMYFAYFLFSYLGPYTIDFRLDVVVVPPPNNTIVTNESNEVSTMEASVAVFFGGKAKYK